MLGFDAYPAIAARLRRCLLDGRARPSHTPRDRRTLLPVTPSTATTRGSRPGPRAPARTARPARRRGARVRPAGRAQAAGRRAVAPVKLASGCDRRCSFCAIPSFRGSFVSRPARRRARRGRAGLPSKGVRELSCVSENSTSYGKDLGDLRLLETVAAASWPPSTASSGCGVSYLQPAEVRPGLLDVMTRTPGVAPYFDLSFQHSSPSVLRRMRRFGDPERFLDLLDDVRDRAPRGRRAQQRHRRLPRRDRGTTSQVLDRTSWPPPGSTSWASSATPTRTAPRPPRWRTSSPRRESSPGRAARTAGRGAHRPRAEHRVGEQVEVLVESRAGEGGVEGGRAHQGPDVDGTTTVLGAPAGAAVGDLVTATVEASRGADLVARSREGGR